MRAQCQRLVGRNLSPTSVLHSVVATHAMHDIVMAIAARAKPHARADLVCSHAPGFVPVARHLCARAHCHRLVGRNLLPKSDLHSIVATHALHDNVLRVLSIAARAKPNSDFV